MFFDKTCNIYSIAYTKVGWSSKRTKTTVYTWIECNFEVAKKGYTDQETANNVNALKYTIILPITYSLIRNNYNIEIIDDTLWSMWTFIISDIQSFKSYSWIVDNITFIATEIKWQL